MRNVANSPTRGWRLRLLLDEDTQAKRLVQLRRTQHHDVVTIAELDCHGASDAGVLLFARAAGRVLLTRNCSDFLVLHRQDANHAGIVCVYQSADPVKSMRYADIAQALRNLQEAQVPLQGEFLALNAWLY